MKMQTDLPAGCKAGVARLSHKRYHPGDECPATYIRGEGVCCVVLKMRILHLDPVNQ